MNAAQCAQLAEALGIPGDPMGRIPVDRWGFVAAAEAKIERRGLHMRYMEALGREIGLPMDAVPPPPWPAAAWQLMTAPPGARVRAMLATLDAHQPTSG